MSGSERIPELDGIRGCAIGLVLLWHLFVWPATPIPGTFWAYAQAAGRLTWTGVDLFFVLSGFLIGGILLDSRQSPNYFRIFYARRFFRIIPAYAVLLIATLLLYLLGDAKRFGFMMEQQLTWPPYLVFLQNFWMAEHNSLGNVWCLAVTWSLAVEEQFYLTLPLVIRRVNLQERLPLILAAVVVAPVLRTLIYYFFPHHRQAAFVLMPCRADALLLGVFGAALLRDAKWKRKLEREGRGLLVALAILVIGAGLLTKYADAQYSGPMVCFGYTWIALLYLCVLLIAVTQPQASLSALLRWRWLGWLGGIAYGVYLFHLFTWGLLIGMGLSWVAASFWTCVVTLLLCRLSWKYFERPLVEFGHGWTGRRPLAESK